MIFLDDLQFNVDTYSEYLIFRSAILAACAGSIQCLFVA